MLTREEILVTARRVLPAGWGFKQYGNQLWFLQMPNGRLATLRSCNQVEDVEELETYLMYRMEKLEQTGGL